MEIAQAYDQLRDAERRFAAAKREKGEAHPGSLEYGVAVRRVGATWHCRQVALARVVRLHAVAEPASLTAQA